MMWRRTLSLQITLTGLRKMECTLQQTLLRLEIKMKRKSNIRNITSYKKIKARLSYIVTDKIL